MYTILVVDDEHSIRELYREELAESGYRVLCASGGREAREALEGQNVHVVVLDIKLKGESGLQILQEIRRKSMDLPVVLSTAYSSFKDDFSSWLADAYVVKSGSLEELKAEVQRVIERRYGSERPN